MAGRGGHNPSPSDEDLKKVVDAVRRHGSQRAAMDELKMTKSTVGYQMKLAARRGFCLDEPPAIMPGFEARSVKTTTDGDGNVTSQTVVQGHESGPRFSEMPPGMFIERMTVNRDGDQNVRQDWLKLKANAAETMEVFDAIKTAFKEHVPVGKIIRAPAACLDHMLSVYPIVDIHLGMLSDGKETGQANDLDKGTARLFEGVDDLVDRAPRSKHALIINPGDFFHANDQRNVTPKSGHQLDVDSRFPKVLIAGVKTLIRIIERAAQKHEFIEYKGLKGNHDPESAIALTVALAMYFANNKRVKIDIEGRDFDWYWRLFGKCYIGATHGHNVKPDMMYRAMTERNPDYWAASTHRWFIYGHIHHDTAKRIGSVKVESFTQPVPGDSHSHQSFPGGAKEMVSIALHADGYEHGRHNVSWPMPLTYRAAA